MCGIAGLYIPNGIEAADLQRMGDAIAHRGPDAHGVFVQNGFGLSHRRLSILDLSSAAHQPMVSTCGRYQICYNGEVYNFRELKSELGLTTRTSSDTEVVLEAFVLLGPAMVNRLNGMFAIAIFDTIEEKMYLFRDRMGIKPLYVYHHADRWAFASELKAITALEHKLPLTVNRSAIPYFLHLGYIPRPLSIYNEVSKFPSGSWAVFDGNNMHITCYWRPEDQISKDTLKNEHEAKAQLETLLTASVKRRLVSDVPFGTFLSGGIDSSVVTALAQKVSPTPVRTFSIGFDNPKHNEAHHAANVARHLGTEHHLLTATEQDGRDLILDIVPQYDEPFADSSAIPTMLVSKLARQHVTMTLSGDGGDELFMGYGAYNWAERLANPAIATLRWPASLLLSLGNDRLKRISKLLAPEQNISPCAHIFSQEQSLFSAKELHELLIDAPAACPLLDDVEMSLHKLNRNLNPSERQAFFDLKLYLQDDLLVKVDRATMRYGLETRVPLLDHTVVEFALNLSPSLKVKNGEAKYLLKQVLYDHVPKALFDRPKWGFSIPLSSWLRGELAFLIDDYLSEQKVNSLGLVHWAIVKELIAKFRGGQHHLYNRIWLLIVLHQWFSVRRSSGI